MRTINDKHIMKIVNNDLKAYPIVQYEMDRDVWLMLEQTRDHLLIYGVYDVVSEIMYNVPTSVYKCGANKSLIPFMRYVRYNIVTK